jgi:hypothetical protein
MVLGFLVIANNLFDYFIIINRCHGISSESIKKGNTLGYCLLNLIACDIKLSSTAAAAAAA